VAALSQDVPRVRFFPSSAQAEEDVAAAKSATEVAQLAERNNRIGNLIAEEAFNLWTDGKVGAYVRFVVDGQRFGFHPETEIAAREVKIGSDVYVCSACGAENKAKRGGLARGDSASAGDKAGDHDDDRQALAPADAESNTNSNEGDDSNIGISCDTCGALLTEEDCVAAEMVTVPTAETRQRVPNGQEVVRIVGGLELKTPPWANQMHEYPYVQWNMEVHQARLRAAYPHAAEKIGSPVAQFLTGAFPALFGGAMSNNDTASGYAMARDQAMWRIGLVWRRMKCFHAGIMLLAVDCFRRNRPNDVKVTLLGAGAAFESKWIRLAGLREICSVIRKRTSSIRRYGRNSVRCCCNCWRIPTRRRRRFWRILITRR
jgi:hypothetical protein